MKKYNGNVEITSNNQKKWAEKLKKVTHISGDLCIHSNAKLDALKSVGDNLYIHSNAKLDASRLESVGGDLYIHSNAKLDALESVGDNLYIYSNTKLEKKLWNKFSKHKWYLTHNCSEYLLSRKGNITYRINGVIFEEKLFHKVRKGLLSAREVFAISNIEQRRIAYEFMPKEKMKELEGFKIIDREKDDNYGYNMQIVEFKLDGYDTPFRYLNCFCPSTGREYFLETKQTKCELAKAMSFGFNEKIKFVEEW